MNASAQILPVPPITPSLKTMFFFNGDADGIISQHLMYMAGIKPDVRITGSKRDIHLLKKVTRPTGARVFVFDVGFEGNRREAFDFLSDKSNRITWFDHHESGDVPVNERLEAHIKTSRGVCTGVIVQGRVRNPDPRWAAAAAFGDNMPDTAMSMLEPLNLAKDEIQMLREMGELLNYNAYGETEEDLLYNPKEIAETLQDFTDPIDFFQRCEIFNPLALQFLDDQAEFEEIEPDEEEGQAAFYLLPDEPFARRMGASFINRLAQENPQNAYAIACPLKDGQLQISVRAPRRIEKPVPPAFEFLRRYPSGGGRAAAGGINRLPAARLEEFKKHFFYVYQ